MQCYTVNNQQNHYSIVIIQKTIGKQTLQLSKRSGDQLVKMIRRSLSPNRLTRWLLSCYRKKDERYIEQYLKFAKHPELTLKS